MLSRAAASFSVRSARAADQSFVEALSGLAFAEYEPKPRAAAKAAAGMKGAKTLIAARGERRLGFVVVGAGAGGRAWIQAIAVEAAERGRGVGQLLMQAAESFAIADGADWLSLYTAEANLAALDLFLRRGFVIVRRAPRFYARGQNACELEKRLR